MYKVTTFRVRVMFLPPWIPEEPGSISLEQNVLMAIYCLRQKQSGSLSSSLKVPIICCPILTKFGSSRQIFIEGPTTKFHANLSSGVRADTCRENDEANRRFLRLFEHV